MKQSASLDDLEENQDMLLKKPSEGDPNSAAYPLKSRQLQLSELRVPEPTHTKPSTPKQAPKPTPYPLQSAGVPKPTPYPLKSPLAPAFRGTDPKALPGQNL